VSVFLTRFSSAWRNPSSQLVTTTVKLVSAPSKALPWKTATSSRHTWLVYPFSERKWNENMFRDLCHKLLQSVCCFRGGNRTPFLFSKARSVGNIPSCTFASLDLSSLPRRTWACLKLGVIIKLAIRQHLCNRRLAQWIPIITDYKTLCCPKRDIGFRGEHFVKQNARCTIVWWAFHFIKCLPHFITYPPDTLRHLEQCFTKCKNWIWSPIPIHFPMWRVKIQSFYEDHILVCLVMNSTKSLQRLH